MPPAAGALPLAPPRIGLSRRKADSLIMARPAFCRASPFVVPAKKKFDCGLDYIFSQITFSVKQK
jgi:hypothetical protein